MPRSFDLSADYDGSVEEVHRVFREEDYWRARLADIPVDEARLESLRVGGESGDDDTIEVVTLQVVRSHNLPALVTQLHRGDLAIRRAETWGPVADGAATASIAGSIVDAPVNVWGTAELSPIADSGRARLTFRISIQVRAPIIGGKVENIIGTRLAELVAAEQRFTTAWIADNA
ncbi:DUF2505 domain-containing protein [Mycobacterium malmoense]|uniref:DUF2505 domain-containing protein n=1 Tax=Mycobacterium malmoense TaxID=1780 RepID=A0ABX3SV01_MYCMA|nr:DUF2505 domain-containing protein [Mycobacterium malmoense]OIN80299.1 hypothetical protein BMG05_13810 [Mycobacterium malmoense]ORA84398.1 hypothetical protein BST29_05115 [Mycobacterium malmoense]QZA17052.1 DUF2505 domain-containing protein [Mycobacterium malmoense]UNB93845.1 DUF2505 domain-containing protein [Mycobacterium malmoense]